MKIEIPYGMTKQVIETGEEAEILTAPVCQNIISKNPQEIDRKSVV